MNTDLGTLIESSIPTFAHKRLERFAEFELREQVAERIHRSMGTVDLSQVAGTEHPDYYGSSWLELLGNPPGRPSGRLKRIHGGLLEMSSNPDYYLSTQKKSNWSFYLVNGKYYISCGTHRTIIGRFLLSCNGLPTVISGVGITELVLHDSYKNRIQLFG
ncbi:hypothetical protein [Acidovorax sp. Leaf73]|uniref:hypothetical protein n=1 Tax=Acidovorax sp. Leaf73 TaxID=2876566 RepID=UPI001E34DCEF|nr:hypothetical protein [Acidovorax sp. Leaf73]